MVGNECKPMGILRNVSGLKVFGVVTRIQFEMKGMSRTIFCFRYLVWEDSKDSILKVRV